MQKCMIPNAFGNPRYPLLRKDSPQIWQQEIRMNRLFLGGGGGRRLDDDGSPLILRPIDLLAAMQQFKNDRLRRRTLLFTLPHKNLPDALLDPRSYPPVTEWNLFSRGRTKTLNLLKSQEEN
jgi:hypothetical protein